MSGTFDDDTAAEERSELIGDALASAEVELELLLRHARTPESLSGEERARVEAYLAASPAHRDRARVMARLAASADPVQALMEGATGSEGEASSETRGGAEVIPLPSRWRTLAPRLAMAASILLMLTIAGLYLSRLSDGDRPPAPRIAERESKSSPPPEHTQPERPAAPETAEPTPLIAEQSPPRPDVPAIPTPPEAPEAAPAPPQLAETVPEARPAPEPSSLAATEPAAEPDAPETSAAREEILLAALVDAGPYAYRTPVDMVDDVRLMGFGRSGGPALVLSPLAPGHVGRTRSAMPTLRWYVSRDVDAEQEIAILDPETRQPVVTIRRPAPTRAGFHALDLAEAGIQLSPEIDYRWVVAIVHDPRRRARDTVAAAEIRHTPEAGDTASVLPIAARGPALAREGLWYDALEVVSQAVEAHPVSAEVRRLRADLLASVGLEAAAAADREAVAPATP